MNKLVDRIDDMFDRIKFKPKPLFGILMFTLFVGLFYLSYYTLDSSAFYLSPFHSILFYSSFWLMIKSKTIHKFVVIAFSISILLWLTVLLFAF